MAPRRRRRPSCRGLRARSSTPHCFVRRVPRLPGGRARFRARRLHGRVPGDGPGPARRAGGALRPLGRRLPERRLHPLQGAAARGPGHHRDRGDGRRTASHSESPRSKLNQAARMEVVGGGPADRRARWAGQAAQGRGRARRVARLTGASLACRRRPRDHVRELHHRRRLPGGHDPGAARRSADHRLDRRAVADVRSRDGCS